MPPRSQKQQLEEANKKLEKLSISDNSKYDNKKKEKKKIDPMNSDSNHDKDETTNDKPHLIKEEYMYLPAGNACLSTGVGVVFNGFRIDPRTFCNDFNQHTAKLKLGTMQPVTIKIYDDHTYTYCIGERHERYFDEKYTKYAMHRGRPGVWYRNRYSRLL